MYKTFCVVEKGFSFLFIIGLNVIEIKDIFVVKSRTWRRSWHHSVCSRILLLFIFNTVHLLPEVLLQIPPLKMKHTYNIWVLFVLSRPKGKHVFSQTIVLRIQKSPKRCRRNIICTNILKFYFFFLLVIYLIHKTNHRSIKTDLLLLLHESIWLY